MKNKLKFSKLATMLIATIGLLVAACTNLADNEPPPLREDFTISFADFRDIIPDISMTGPSIRLVGSPAETSATITVINPLQYDRNSIRWIFDGTQITGNMVSGSHGEKLTLGPRIHSNPLGEGTHFLTVEVSVNGVPFSRRIEFAVTR